jgi:hypothetical protein
VDEALGTQLVELYLQRYRTCLGLLSKRISLEALQSPSRMLTDAQFKEKFEYEYLDLLALQASRFAYTAQIIDLTEDSVEVVVLRLLARAQELRPAYQVSSFATLRELQSKLESLGEDLNKL